MPEDVRSARDSAPTIGFHELRQAFEISTLREELERVLQETAALRGHIEDAVEQVRTRFAALTPEEITDSAAMAALLQFSVGQLIALRDRARAVRADAAPLPDAERRSWDATAPRAYQSAPASAPERIAPTFSSAPTANPPIGTPTGGAPLKADPPAAPRPVTAAESTSTSSAAAPQAPSESWLSPPGLRTPARPAPGASPGSASRPTGASQTVDWLQPARR